MNLTYRSSFVILSDYFYYLRYMRAQMSKSERIKHYVIEGTLGKGSYGNVYLCRDEITKEHVTLKKIQVKNDPQARKNVQSEATLLRELRHPSIISLIDSFFSDDGDFCIILEYADAKDLNYFIRNHQNIPEKKVLQIFTQIILALQFIHEKGVLHRDIKAANVFLFKNGLVKLGDFGISRKMGEGELASTIIGTPYFMCPELVQGKSYTYPADIWAAGCVLFEMLTHEHAFKGSSRKELFTNITRYNIGEFPKEYSQELVNLMKWMLSMDPAKRPTCNDILKTNIISKGLQALKDKLIKLQHSSSREISRKPSSRQSSSSRKKQSPVSSDSRFETTDEDEIDQQKMPEWLIGNAEVLDELGKQSEKQLRDAENGLLDCVRQSISKISFEKLKDKQPLTQLTGNVEKRKEDLISQVRSVLGENYDVAYSFIKAHGQDNHGALISKLKMNKNIDAELKKLEIITAIEELA